MLQEFIKAFSLIFVAEMGDKTQILAMAFATRFPVRKVLLGIFLGAALNHGLAVLLGSTLSRFIPLDAIQIVAGFAFIFFALWTLKPDGGEEEENVVKSKYGPVLTVALAFFIGELGDKTQLTAITLATDATFPLVILCGTVFGMIVTGGIGIVIGRQIGDKVPEFAINIMAASVFLFFGIIKLVQTLPTRFLAPLPIALFAVVVGGIMFYFLQVMFRMRKQGRETAFARQSRAVYEYYHQVKEQMDRICLGLGVCGECQGDHCLVGYTKSIIRKGLDADADREAGVVSEENEFCFVPSETTFQKEYNRDEMIRSLAITLALVKDEPDKKAYVRIHAIRKQLEQMLFGQSIDHVISWSQYLGEVNTIDSEKAQLLQETTDRLIAKNNQVLVKN